MTRVMSSGVLLLLVVACSPQPPKTVARGAHHETALPLRVSERLVSVSGAHLLATGHWEPVSGRLRGPRIRAALVECVKAESRCDEYETNVFTKGDETDPAWEGLILQTHTRYAIAAWNSTQVAAREVGRSDPATLNIAVRSQAIHKEVSIHDRAVAFELR